MRYIKVLAPPVAVMATSVTLASTAIAATLPDESGKKFSEAEPALTSAGFTVVVTSVVGDKLQRNDCLVVHEKLIPPREAPYEVAAPKDLNNTRVLVSLDCTAPSKAKSP
jgi:hypothetical protein